MTSNGSEESKGGNLIFGSWDLCFRQGEKKGGEKGEEKGENYYHKTTCPHNKQCILKPCPNIIMCGHSGPFDILDCHGGRCYPCNLFFRENLTFRIGLRDEECSICLQSVEAIDLVKFTNCTHFSCISCYKFIHHIDDEPIINPPKELISCFQPEGEEEEINDTETREFIQEIYNLQDAGIYSNVFPVLYADMYNRLSDKLKTRLTFLEFWTLDRLAELFPDKADLSTIFIRWLFSTLGDPYRWWDPTHQFNDRISCPFCRRQSGYLFI